MRGAAALTAWPPQEPAAFWGGVFAGVLRLSLDADPLRTWVERTSAQARVSDPHELLRTWFTADGFLARQKQRLSCGLCAQRTRPAGGHSAQAR
jgi:hypothetical protein